jgi:hypothetical protein
MVPASSQTWFLLNARALLIFPHAHFSTGCRFLGFPRAARPPREPTAARSPLAARKRPSATAASFLGITFLIVDYGASDAIAALYADTFHTLKVRIGDIA